LLQKTDLWQNAVLNKLLQGSNMKTFYEIKDGVLAPSTEDFGNVVVYSGLDEAEKQQLKDSLNITRHDLDSAFDPDEVSRVEFTTDHIYIIWKRPDNVSFEHELKFKVSSVGLFLQQNKLIVILGDSNDPFINSEFKKITSLSSVVLKFFLYSIHHYLAHLKVIKQLTTELQTKLNVSAENRYLIQMFALGESLIYYINALETNSSVLNKLRSNTDKMGLSREEIEGIDDIIIEHQQCSRQTEIYSSVLSGLMDARGSIINNNMNVLLRNLTIINVVFLPLNLIASIGGMSEFSMMTRFMSWKVSYSLFMVAMVVLGWLIWVLLIKKFHVGSR